MKRINLTINLLAAIIVVGWLSPLYAAPQNTCVQCHQDAGGDLAKPIQDVKGDVHGSRGLSCRDCHGGDSTSMDDKVSMDPAKGWIGKPTGLQRISMCTRCHSDPILIKKYNPTLRVDQMEQYWTSVHGQVLKKGDGKVATCSNCHGHHGVYAHKDSRSSIYPTNIPETCGKCHANADYMKQYGIPTNQLADYKQSIHGENLLKKGDLGSPACNNCHGNHGATPPGIKSIAYVCSQCHPVQEELFIASPHGVALEKTGTPSCMDCHNKHKIQHPTDDLLGVSAGGICTACHSDGDPGWAVGKAMKLDVETLKKNIKEASGLLSVAEDSGMPSVDARYDLRQAESALVQSRTLIHSFTLATVEAATKKGDQSAVSAKQAATKFFGELKFRKAGLWVMWVFIAIFVLGMSLKIKDLNRERRKL